VRHTLNKTQRLKSRKLIGRLFDKGRSFSFPPFRAYYLLDEDQTHAGESLLFGTGASSRHFKRAVDRNRIKRLIREAYRLQCGELRLQMKTVPLKLTVFVLYTGRDMPVYADIAARMDLLLKKLSGVVEQQSGAAS
jgi:ribonuclease P protein component